MNACEPELLSAFIDGELDAATRQRVEAHITTCPKCAAEVKCLRELSQSFASYRFADLNAGELTRLHRELDDQVDAPIWRLGGAMGLIAASILVVAATWLAAIPASKPRATNGIVVQAPAEWEMTAMTLRVDVPGDAGGGHLEEWMLDQLALADGSQP